MLLLRYHDGLYGNKALFNKVEKEWIGVWGTEVSTRLVIAAHQRSREAMALLKVTVAAGIY